MADLTIADKSTQATTTTNTGLGNRHLGLYDRGGNIKAVRYSYINDSGAALNDGDIVQLCSIGPCLVLPTSVITTSAMGTGRTLDVGFQEYTETDGDTVSSDIDAFLDGLDVSSAVLDKRFGSDTASLTKGDGHVLTGRTDVLAKIIGGTLPTNGTLEGFIFVIDN